MNDEQCNCTSITIEVQLHPLMHGLLNFTVAQDIESIKKRSRSSAKGFEKSIPQLDSCKIKSCHSFSMPVLLITPRCSVHNVWL